MRPPLSWGHSPWLPRPWLAGGEGPGRPNSPGCHGRGEGAILPPRGSSQLPCRGTGCTVWARRERHAKPGLWNLGSS